MAVRSESAALSNSPERTTGKTRVESARPAVALGPLGERLGYVLRRAQVAVFQDFDAAFSNVDVRPVQYSVLTIIEHNPGLSQTKVAETLGIRKANFVAIVDALEARSLLRRAATPGDRRSYALFLTDDGRTLMRRLHRLAAAHERRIIAKVGAQAHRRLIGELAAIACLRER